MRAPDATAAAVVLAVAAIAISEAARLPFGMVRNPGPGFLPWWAGVALGVLALACLAQALRARPAPGPAAGWGRLAKVAGLVGVLTAYVLVLGTVGYPVSTFVLVLFMLRVVDPHRWAVALGVAALAALGSYVVFAVWLQVPLPAGLWR